MSKHGPIQFIFTDSGSNFQPIANIMTGTKTDKMLKDNQWIGHSIKELLDPKYQKQLNVLGGSLILEAKGKHSSMASAENIVRLLKYSLKASNAWSALQSGKLSIFQIYFIIQSIVCSLNSHALCIINKKLISPSYMQNLMFDRAYSEDVLLNYPSCPKQKKQKNLNIYWMQYILQ